MLFRRLTIAAALACACNQAPAQAPEAQTNMCAVYVAPKVDESDPRVKELMNQILEAVRELGLQRAQVRCMDGTLRKLPRPQTEPEYQ